MLIPTLQDLSKIIEKMKILRHKQIAFINRKYSKSSAKKAAKKAVDESIKPELLENIPPIEELIRYNVNNKIDDETEELNDDTITLIINNDIESLRNDIIPNLKDNKIVQLLNEFIPSIKQGLLSKDKLQYLEEIEYSLKSELARKEKQIQNKTNIIAKGMELGKEADLIRRKPKDYWPPPIQDLMNEIVRLIFPYREFLKKNSSYKESGSTSDVYPIFWIWIEAGDLSELDFVIQEFEKIRYKMEVESQRLLLDKSDEIKPKGNGGQATTSSVDKACNEEQRTSETDLITINNDRKIELINDFCNWTDKLIDYIKNPDVSREVSKARIDTIADHVNDLAQKIWTQIDFGKIGWPYRYSDISECTVLHSGSIFSVEPELRERIIQHLQQWKDRALKDKSNLQKLLIPQKKKETVRVRSQEEGVQSETNVPDYEAQNLFKVPVSKLIKYRERNTLEFKETLEYDVKQNKRNQDLNKECLKTIAAFLNTDGGTLLIGVKDNGEVTGIERDLQYVQRKNLDGFELKLRNFMRDRFDPAPLGKVDVKFEKIEDVTVCRIDVNPLNRSQTVHLDNEVYIRDGNTTMKLEGRKLTDWIQQRSQYDNIDKNK